MHAKQEVILKTAHRTGFLLLLVVSFVLALSAQDSAPSLGDLARQERARKQQQSASVTQADADAAELSGLTEANFKANILITESHAETEKWVLMPAADRPGAGRLRQLVPGKKYYLPFVVTDYPWPASEQMNLTAHVRFISPAGRILFGAAKFSETIAPDPRSPSVIVLNPVMDITSDPGDPLGTYTVRVTITDHIHSVFAKAEEQFQLVPEAGAESKAGK
jgi:hypothetical protein